MSLPCSLWHGKTRRQFCSSLNRCTPRQTLVSSTDTIWYVVNGFGKLCTLHLSVIKIRSWLMLSFLIMLSTGWNLHRLLISLSPSDEIPKITFPRPKMNKNGRYESIYKSFLVEGRWLIYNFLTLPETSMFSLVWRLRIE